MDLFSLLMLSLKEADRLAANESLTPAERDVAALLASNFRSMRGTAFKFRDYPPPAATKPAP